MAQRKFNSVEGFSVGIPGNVIAVVDNVANVYANRVFVQQYANLGDVGNIYIGGGLNNQVLKTDGSGSLYWALDTAPAGGNTTEVQFNNGGSLDGTSAFTFDNISNALSITGNITSVNASLGNLVTANYFSGILTTQAQPNVTSVGTLTSLNVSGNSTSAYFIGNGSSLTHLNGANVTGQVSNALVAGTVYSNAQPNITSVGELVDLTVTGNVSADYYIGDGSLLTNVNGSNVSNVANANYATFAGTVITSAQPNITSVGTLVDANISGNILVGGNLVVNGNTVYTNVETLVIEDPVIELGGGPNGDPLTTNDGKDRGTLLHYYTTETVNAFMGWDNSASEFAFGSNVTLSSEVATFNTYGNVRAGYFLGNGSQLTGTIANANYAAYAGNVTNSAQSNITSLGTLSSLTVSGLIAATGGIKVGNLQDTSGTNTIQLTNSDVLVTGNIVAGTGGTGNVTATYFIGNLVGSDLTVNGIANLGSISNVKITGGTNGYVIQTDGTGNLSFISAGSSGIAGSNTQVQFNDNGSFGATAGFTFDKVSNTIAVTGNASATYFIGDGSRLTNITGANINGQVSNALVAGTVYTNAQPNITSVGILTSLEVTGNVDVDGILFANTIVGQSTANVTVTAGAFVSEFDDTGNITLSDNVSVVNNLSAANVLTDHLLYANGVAWELGGTYANSNVANYLPTYSGQLTAGNVNVTGNITSAYFIGNASSLINITGANVNGQVSNALVAGSVYTNAQPNITSVGTLTSLIVTTTANVGILNSTDGAFSGNVVVTGNLTVHGNTNYINVDSFVVEDPIIEMGGGANGAPLTTNDGKDRGSLLHYYTTTPVNAFMGWDNSAGEFAFGSNVSVTNEVVTFNSLGNVRANYFLGNAASLTGLNASSIASGTISSGILGNSTLYVGTTSIALNRTSGSQSLTGVSIDGSAGTVTTNAQPNITSVGTLTSLSVTANVSAGNVLTNHLLYANGVEWNFGSTYSNANVAAYLPTYTGNVSANYFIGNGSQLTGLPAGYSNADVANYLPTYTGNVSANYFIGNGATLTFITGANVDGQVSNALVAGTVYTNAQPNITSVGILTSVDVTGNASAGNVLTDHLLYSNGAPYVFTTTAAGSNTQIQFNDNTAFAGNANLTFNKTTNTVTTDNIDLNGNLTVNGLTDLGGIGNITISGGAAGYVLTTNGAGGLTWGAAGGAGGAAGFVSIVKDRFLTTGSANTFTLSTVPSSKNLIEVVIDGLQQISNTYSLTGAVLSFPTNPAAGEVIEVTTYGTVDLTGNITEVQYNAGGEFGSSNTFTFNSGTNTLSVTHLTATGNLTSQAGYVYVNNGIIAVDSGNAGIFNTSVANINLGLAANVTVGSTTGNTTIRGNLLANTASIGTLSVGDYYSSRTAVTVTTDTIIDQFPVSTYRSAKYTMRVNSDDGYQAVEVLLVHNGSSSYVTIYGSISSSGSDIITMSSNIGSGNVRLFASTASTNTNVKILGTYVPD